MLKKQKKKEDNSNENYNKQFYNKGGLSDNK